MGKIGIIIRWEFNERVRKRSFIITTILTPLLMAAVMFTPLYLANMKPSGTKQVIVVDRSGIAANKIGNTKSIEYTISDKSFDELRKEKRQGGLGDIFGILVIGSDVMTNPRNVQLYTYQSSTLDTENAIARQISDAVETEKLKEYNIDNLQEIMQEVRTNVSLQAFRIDDSDRDTASSSALSLTLSFAFGLLIYMFVFLYGGMVMQGVIEEKSSKVLEVMVSSVRPFQLMMGKIIGIAAVALTQFLIWIVLIFVLGAIFMSVLTGDAVMQAASVMADGAMPAAMEGINPETLAAIRTVTDVGFMLKLFVTFIVYFIGGYLLYAAMFAAIGSAVDNSSDAQQLQLPITIPMILAIFVMMSVVNDPHSSMAVWFSMIPFTSPIIMLARIPYGVPFWEVVVSVILLYISFMIMVWLAGKIYRVGIFMYGKKPTFKEILRWAKYKY